MFTVLIQNEKTLQSFHQHLPLFNHFLNQEHESQQLEVCLWNEEGQTIEDALPDLARLTDAKPWHAIIVRHEEDDLSSTASSNPYDFSSSKPLSLEEQMANPLIRLTKWLSKPLEYGSLANVNAQDKVAPYQGLLPESITLVSVRTIDSLLSVPSSIRTLERMDFVDRNGYPSYCRFGVVDRQEQGPSARMKSDLEFWSIVLMLACNRFDSSSMAAYTLYALSCTMDKAQMTRLWNDKLQEIQKTISQIHHFLKHQSVYFESQGHTLPDYRIPLDLFKVSALSKDPIVFSSYQHRVNEPLHQAQVWHDQNEKLKTKILADYERFPEELQKKVSTLQLRPGYQEEDVKPLDHIGLNRLKKEIEALNLRLIQEEALLPNVHFESGDLFDLESQNVESLLAKRMSRLQFLRWTIGLCGFCILAMGFSGLTLLKTSLGLWACFGMTLLLGLIPLGICLFFQHKKNKQIQNAMERWNERLEDHYQALYTYKTQYALWLADVLSYRQAQSYYEIALQKSLSQEHLQRELETLLANLYAFQDQLLSWAKALNLALAQPKEMDPYGLKSALPSWTLDPRLYLDWFKQKELFCFETQTLYECSLSKSGKHILTPFSFLQTLTIEPFRSTSSLRGLV